MTNFNYFTFCLLFLYLSFAIELDAGGNVRNRSEESKSTVHIGVVLDMDSPEGGHG